VGIINPCSHLDWVRHPETPGFPPACAECAREGAAWVQLRMCLTCGYVGCCDNSPNRHASGHFRASRHPLMRSLEPGERWVWCHLDRIAFPLDALPGQL
jgi:CPA1 family monovalent cation:H+ antiporter